MCYGDQLKCDFINVDFKVNQYDSLYSCQVTSLDNSNTINDYNGVHSTSKNVKDVKALWIYQTNTRYIPENLGSLFNLISFAMQNTNLVEIKVGLPYFFRSKSGHHQKQCTVGPLCTDTIRC